VYYPAGQRVARRYLALLVSGLMMNIVLVMMPLLRRPDYHWFPQGRFLFPSVLVVAVLLYRGWANLIPRKLRPWLLPLVVVGGWVMDTAALIVLAVRSYC